MRQVLLPKSFYLAAVVYFMVTVLGHWQLRPTLGTLVFGIGGIIGLHLLDATELAIDITSAPFRNPLTQLTLIVLMFFVVTSSQTNLGSGVVLFLQLRLILEQWFTFNKDRNLSAWLPQAPSDQQQTYLLFISLLFIVATLLFIFI